VGASSGAEKTTPGETLRVHSVLSLGQIRAGLHNPVIFDRAKTNVVRAEHESQLQDATSAVNTTQMSSRARYAKEPVNRLVSASRWSDAGNPMAAQEPQRPTTPDGHS
jgi:hypothetical protein